MKVNIEIDIEDPGSLGELLDALRFYNGGIQGLRHNLRGRRITHRPDVVDSGSVYSIDNELAECERRLSRLVSYLLDGKVERFY
jgi:hypothetical protein